MLYYITTGCQGVSESAIIAIASPGDGYQEEPSTEARPTVDQIRRSNPRRLRTIILHAIRMYVYERLVDHLRIVADHGHSGQSDVFRCESLFGGDDHLAVDRDVVAQGPSHVGELPAESVNRDMGRAWRSKIKGAKEGLDGIGSVDTAQQAMQWLSHAILTNTI